MANSQYFGLGLGRVILVKNCLLLVLSYYRNIMKKRFCLQLEHEKTCDYRPYQCPCPGASCKWQGSLEQVDIVSVCGHFGTRSKARVCKFLPFYHCQLWVGTNMKLNMKYVYTVFVAGNASPYSSPQCNNDTARRRHRVLSN